MTKRKGGRERQACCEPTPSCGETVDVEIKTSVHLLDSRGHLRLARSDEMIKGYPQSRIQR